MFAKDKMNYLQIPKHDVRIYMITSLFSQRLCIQPLVNFCNYFMTNLALIQIGWGKNVSNHCWFIEPFAG